MKTVKTTVVVLMALLALSLTSCKTDDDGGAPGDATAGTVTARVDGDAYESDVMGTQGQFSDSQGMSILTVTSNEFSTSKNITLVLVGFDGEGTYMIGGGANIFATAQYFEANASNPTESQIWSAPFDDTVQGEINVSSFSDTQVEGTFEFTAKNEDGSTVTVTDGSFNVSI